MVQIRKQPRKPMRWLHEQAADTTPNLFCDEILEEEEPAKTEEEMLADELEWFFAHPPLWLVRRTSSLAVSVSPDSVLAAGCPSPVSPVSPVCVSWFSEC